MVQPNAFVESNDLLCMPMRCLTAFLELESAIRRFSQAHTATLLRMRPRYEMGRTMTKVGFPTTVTEAAQYIELADAAYMRGFTRGDASSVLAGRLSRNQGTHAVARFPVTR